MEELMKVLMDMLVIIVISFIWGVVCYGIRCLCLEVTKKVKLLYKNYKDKRKPTDVEIGGHGYRSITRFMPNVESSFNNHPTIFPRSDIDTIPDGDLPNHNYIQATHVDHSTILPGTNNNDQQLRRDMLSLQRDLYRDLERRQYEVIQNTVYGVVGTLLYGLTRVSDGEVVLRTMVPNEKYRLPLEPLRDIKKIRL